MFLKMYKREGIELKTTKKRGEVSFKILGTPWEASRRRVFHGGWCHIENFPGNKFHSSWGIRITFLRNTFLGERFFEVNIFSKKIRHLENDFLRKWDA